MSNYVDHGEDERRGLWACDDCGFAFAKEHTSDDDGGHECQVCAQGSGAEAAAAESGGREAEEATMNVRVSYEEQMLNELMNLPHKRGEDTLAWQMRKFHAMREVLQPLYRGLQRIRNTVRARGEPPDHEAALVAIGKIVDEVMWWENA